MSSTHTNVKCSCRPRGSAQQALVKVYQVEFNSLLHQFPSMSLPGFIITAIFAWDVGISRKIMEGTDTELSWLN